MTNESFSFEESCISDGGELFDRWKRICIPSMHLGYLFYNPWTSTTENKTNVYLEVSNLQINKIRDDTITFTMIMELEWFEYRLELNTHGSSYRMISLSKAE